MVSVIIPCKEFMDIGRALFAKFLLLPPVNKIISWITCNLLLFIF